MTTTPRIAFLASPADDAQDALGAMTASHGQTPPDDADVLVGNGFAAVVPIATGPCELATALAEGAANLQRAVATAMRLYQL